MTFPTLSAARTSPVLAAILSLIWPGLGQLYAGKAARGLAMMILTPLA